MEKLIKLTGEPLLKGREVIYVSIEPEDVTAQNVVGIVKYAKPIHDQNAREIDYLYNYFLGNQPILNREKLIRPEINNKIVVQRAQEIVNFKKGYEFAYPVQYVSRADGSSEEISKLNAFMLAEDKEAKDAELAEWMYVAGTAYRLVVVDNPIEPEEAPFSICTLDPRNTFVIYSTSPTHPTVLAGLFIEEIGIDGKTRTKVCAYSKTKYFEFYTDNETVKETAHILGAIPIIEYPYNTYRMGAFEPVIPLLNLINIYTSNRANGVEQFIQAYFKFINCDIDADKFDEFKERGAIALKGQIGLPADMDLVAKELDQNQIQTAIDDAYDATLMICGIPGREARSGGGGDTGQAVQLRNGWAAAEARAKSTEIMFKKSERQFLKLVLRVCKSMSATEITKLTPAELDIKFTRNRSDNLLVKTQSLTNLLQAGVAPEVSLAAVDLFSDPHEVYQKSKATLEVGPPDATETPPAQEGDPPM